MRCSKKGAKLALYNRKPCLYSASLLKLRGGHIVKKVMIDPTYIKSCRDSRAVVIAQLDACTCIHDVYMTGYYMKPLEMH